MKDLPDILPRKKPNPVEVALKWLNGRLIEKESGFWLDGNPVSLDQVMRETNRVLKAHGIEQILSSDKWRA